MRRGSGRQNINKETNPFRSPKSPRPLRPGRCFLFMSKEIKTEQVKDVIANLKDALYWTNRVAVDPAQVNLPSDEYDQPEQASLAITQAITLLTQMSHTVGDTNQE